MSTTTAHAIRLDGYVRVSRVGRRRSPNFISPSVQREAIEEWAARQGFVLHDVFEEVDTSAAPGRRRPLLELAVRRIEEGASAGLVVWRVDRFGRSLADGVQTIERIRKVDGRFYSVNDGLDISTESGRLALRILLSVAEFQLEGLRSSWQAARENAIRRGVYLAPGSPVGYRKTRSGRLRPDPKLAPVIAELYRRRIAGETLSALGRWLMEQGVLTSNGNPGWPGPNVARLLGSHAYFGEVHSGQFVNLHAHPPIVDAATWEAAQQPAAPLRREWPPLLLSGLARCAACSHMLSPHWSLKADGRLTVSYLCKKYYVAGVCPGRASMTTTKLEPYVLEAMHHILARRRRGRRDRLATAEAKADAAEQGMIRYRDNDRIASTIGQAAFAEGLARRQERLRDARLAVIDARAQLGMHELPPADDVRRSMEEMSLSEQRELIAKVIDVVFVSDGSGPAEERVTVCPVGTAPRNLPRIGDKKSVIRAIEPRRTWINPKSATQEADDGGGGELPAQRPTRSRPAADRTRKAHARAG